MFLGVLHQKVIGGKQSLLIAAVGENWKAEKMSVAVGIRFFWEKMPRVRLVES